MNTRKDKALQDPDNTELKKQKNIIKNYKNASAAKRGRKAGSKTKNPEAVNLDNAPSVSALSADIGSVPVRKRGRPKGSGKGRGSLPGSRPDRGIQANKGDNTRFLTHDLKLMSLPAVDMEDPSAIHNRIHEYFSICAEDDIKPSVESFALSLHASRFDIFNWLNGRSNRIKNSDSILALKRAYDTINSYYAHMIQNGKINPVAAIFLMKNNLGYQDTTNYIVSTGNEHTENIDDIASKAGLLND